MAGKGSKLVIVESPAKVRSIGQYLGEEYRVEASVGHIRDLPTPSELPADMKKGPYGKFAVDVENGFEPYYVVDADKKKKVTELKRALKEADELYLATDEDREGEAIAWHLLQTLKPKVPVKRMVFHEITKDAIQRAIHNTRDLDERLVDAQESRRILDRLYGYEVSPVLWRKVRQGLSAGRVQSVATRLVVERERARMAFRIASYWGVEAELAPGSGDADAGQIFAARLSAIDGTRVATGRDFTDAGDLRTGTQVVHLDQQGAESIAAGIQATTVRVAEVSEKPYTRRPAAPFITSTLQQEASRKLRLGSKDAMRVAQRLYENGFITYMRTDSTVLSQSAITAARQQARDLYGPDYVPDSPRHYGKQAKGAQEAHEAIRPAGETFRTPAQVAGELRGSEYALYELIWKRTVASQMADATGSTASVRLSANLSGVTVGGSPARNAELSASGTVITFRGFLAAYEEGKDGEAETSSKGQGGKNAREARLPAVQSDQELVTHAVEPGGHETSPPARYTEATLVKALEEKGIGRPSTYAATVGTIADRGYVRSKSSALVPTWLAFAVTSLLEKHFDRLVNYDFTASMEEGLDAIARGDEDRVAWLERFYFGDEATSAEGLAALVEDLGEIDAKGVSTIEIGDGVVVRVGRYGPYVEEVAPAGTDPATGEVPEGSQAIGSDTRGADSGGAGTPSSGAESAATATSGTQVGEEPKPLRASITDDIAPDELTPAMAREFLAEAASDGRVLGQNPETGRDVIAKTGRYGPYVTEVFTDEDIARFDAEGLKTSGRGKDVVKPPTSSLFESMDVRSIDLEQALRLLSLPRVVGVDPESGDEITAQNGRYGPYLKKGTDSRSLESEEQIFDITLEEALKIYAEPKRRGRSAARPPIAEFAEDPVSGKKVVIKEGRFGPYVTDGETNATVPRSMRPEDVSELQAFELLATKRLEGPKKKPARKSSGSSSKSTAKPKTTTKRTVKAGSRKKS